MEDRLSRLEQKIDMLSEAVVSLARVEERLVTVFNRQSHIEAKVEAIDNKVDELSQGMVSSKLVERLIWVIIVAGISTAFTLLGN
jgi:hypothetical protein